MSPNNSPTVIAIDPGYERSAWVVYADGEIQDCDITNNEDLVYALNSPAVQISRLRENANNLAIEMIDSYGMPVGQHVFQTIFWAGRFVEAFGGEFSQVYRRDIKLHLCGSMRAKDSNVRQALIDRFGPGREKAIGTKKNPGPLYGIKKDLWAALAVAVTWSDTQT